MKAHQDDDTQYAQLPQYAQLNVDADTLASEFQDAYGSVRPILLMIPSTRVLLHLPHGSITGKFASTLRTAYSGPPLLQAIQSKNSWSDSTAESVHCEAHALSLGKHSNRSTHYTELAHNILPTNSWLNKLDKGKRPCPCCVEPREDQDHILRCPAATRNRWRHEFLKSVADYCVHQHTYPPMKALLMDALRKWLYSHITTVYEPIWNQYPTHLHTLKAAQNWIGWQQVFNRRFCKRWSELQDEYYYRERATIPTKKNQASHGRQV
jgi:hypothetical protein